jgi:glycosyltransferase involved in cell wall biosynthesis
MAGPDSDKLGDGLRALAHRHGVADRITWTGMLQGRLKWGALRAADVFALPSHQENFGVAVVEALSVGLPVLISQRVNIWREVVEDGAGLADADTARGMAALLMQWHALAAAERLAMRTRAIACYQRRFRMEAAASRLVATIAPHLRAT